MPDKHMLDEGRQSMGIAIHKNTNKPDGTTDNAWYAYVCGHCGTKVSGAVVARFHGGNTFWLMCPECERGSVYTAADAPCRISDTFGDNRLHHSSDEEVGGPHQEAQERLNP